MVDCCLLELRFEGAPQGPFFGASARASGLPCRKSQEASLANLLGFYLAIWLMRFPFLSSILFS